MANKELEIQQTEEIFDLETLITEGADATIPIDIVFPDGKKAAAMITPISTADFRSVYTGDKAEMLVNLLELGLLNKKGEPIQRNLIELMPVGVTSKICKEICAISGLELNPGQNINAQDLMDNAELFP